MVSENLFLLAMRSEKLMDACNGITLSRYNVHLFQQALKEFRRGLFVFSGV